MRTRECTYLIAEFGRFEADGADVLLCAYVRCEHGWVASSSLAPLDNEESAGLERYHEARGWI
jgi:hypothetical protein